MIFIGPLLSSYSLISLLLVSVSDFHENESNESVSKPTEEEEGHVFSVGIQFIPPVGEARLDIDVLVTIEWA